MNNLIPIEHQNQRILTTQQIAESYGTDSQIIVNNFNRNKERYTEGKHFYCLEGEEKREFINLNQIDVGLNSQYFYLWTEKGAWLHAKSLGTDEAWNAYEMLVDEYYAIKAKQVPLTIEDMIIMQAQSVKELKTKVEEIDIKSEHAIEQAQLAHKRVDEMDNTDTIGDTRQRLVRKVQKYAERNGLTYSQGWKDFRQAFNTAFRTNLSLRRKYYMESWGIKKMSVPEYLEATDQLPDALRVAEKMLQPSGEYVTL